MPKTKPAPKSPLEASQAFTKYKIGPDDLVIIHGHELKYAKEYDQGVVLRPANDRGKAKTKAYDWKEISQLLRRGTMEIDVGHYSERNAIMRARNAKSFEMSPLAIFRARMASEFIAQEEGIDGPSERYHRSEEDIKRFFAVFHAENEALLEEVRRSIAETGKGKLFISPRQFCRVLERFEECELDPVSLESRHGGNSSWGSSFTREELAFQLEYADMTRTEDQPPVNFCWNEMILENDRRKANGGGMRVPSLTTFQRLVREGNDFLNEVGRSQNKHRIERKYGFAQKGLQVKRPLEIVEMDEHEVDLMVMFTKNGIWDLFPREVQVRIEKMGRVWLSAALDAFTRSLCGLKILTGSPDGSSAVATLAMVAQQKDRVAALAGARSPWPQGGTPGAIHTDAGTGYTSSKFEIAVMMLTGQHRIPPSKHPHLRARMERFFRTINQRYIHLFSGQTFSSILKKDEYDSEKHAHLTDGEFADLIVRLIVDCYHNTKHRALGMTPLEAWYRGTQLAEGAVLPPPSDTRYREIFGTTLRRSITNNGIDILGNHYVSRELLEIRKKWFRAKLTVRMNDQDISVIAVKHRRLNKWIEVPSVFDGLKGVTLEEWAETRRYVVARFGAGTEHSQEIVRKSLAAVREIIAASKKRPGVALHVDLEAKIAMADSTLGAIFGYNQPQPYDFGRYDDGIDHEDDDEEDGLDVEVEAAIATARKKGKRKTAKERTVVLLETAADPFNPGVSGKVYSQAGFLTPEQRGKTPGSVSMDGDGRSRPQRPANPTRVAGPSAADLAKEDGRGVVAPVSAPEVKRKKTIRIEGKLGETE
ncbi:Mu transposase C-terminal domain-containing protein [Pararhizobium qamdonense]|uniref:Mu transposase C-terminal domain-containing protein n=1 Tax=Pararhizobium qamdonense TaxID=3031126 RepID=UPI0023E1D7F5|nr:Mu transposase C-terminal domain-containing protein [Pararhizobium qamdonense]